MRKMKRKCEKRRKDMEFAKYVDLSEARNAEFLEFSEILVACST